MNRYIKYIFCSIFFVSCILIVFLIKNHYSSLSKIPNPFLTTINVPNLYSTKDDNKNGVADSIDIVNGARKEVTKETKYVSNYYNEGYPPEGEGVCTDVIWRGFSI